PVTGRFGVRFILRLPAVICRGSGRLACCPLAKTAGEPPAATTTTRGLPETVLDTFADGDHNSSKRAGKDGPRPLDRGRRCEEACHQPPQVRPRVRTSRVHRLVELGPGQRPRPQTDLRGPDGAAPLRVPRRRGHPADGERRAHLPPLV